MEQFENIEASINIQHIHREFNEINFIHYLYICFSILINNNVCSLHDKIGADLSSQCLKQNEGGNIFSCNYILMQ